MKIGTSLSSIEIYKRLIAGEKCQEDEWDYATVPSHASAIRKKYDINFGDRILTDDTDLLNRLFGAGMEMLLTTGIYCPDLGRSLRITEDELWNSIDEAPRKVTLGHGKDAVTLEARRCTARRRPLVNGGPTAAMVSENMFQKVMQSYAQEKTVDTLYCGIMNTYRGMNSKPNTPLEIYKVMSEIKGIEMAKANCGRHGMSVFGPESAITAAGRISSDLTNVGMRPHDGHDIPLRNELKIDLTSLNMLAAAEVNNSVVMTEELPIYGGYSGGLEETAICDVATHLAAAAIYGADLHTDGPIHIRWGVTTHRDTLKILAHVGAALDQNTGFHTGSMYYTAAGPCTEMCFLENAAQAITDAMSGREIISTCASAKGVVLDKTTGMEARFAGKTLQAASGMKMDDANDILDWITSWCESQYGIIPEGMRFQDCYYVDELIPTMAHQEIYSSTVDELRALGLRMRC